MSNANRPARPLTIDAGSTFTDGSTTKRMAVIPEVSAMADNLRAAYRAACDTFDSDTLSDCTNWYRNANNWAQGIADAYGLDLSFTCRFIAMFSANASWDANKASVETVLNAHTTGADILAFDSVEVRGKVQRQFKIKLYGSLRMRQLALAMLADNSTPHVAPKSKAFKVLNFGANIEKPNCAQAVTCDRHAARIATGIEDCGVPTGATYQAIAQAYCEAASSVGLLPCELQAVVWYARVGDMA